MLEKVLMVLGFLLGLHFIWKGFELFSITPDGDGIGITLVLFFEYLVQNSMIAQTSIILMVLGIVILILSGIFTVKYFKKIRIA